MLIKRVESKMRSVAFLRRICYANSRGAASWVKDLPRLVALDPAQCRIVELRFFGGLTVEEVAEVMKISTATVKREWRTAKAWLYEQIAGTPE
jgi:predicted DNA-binding protein (UPF0251 family)